jgi:hypothetical protein
MRPYYQQKKILEREAAWLMLSMTNRVDLLSIEEDLFFFSGAGAAGFGSFFIFFV